jgi:hypothetical protein
MTTAPVAAPVAALGTNEKNQAQELGARYFKSGLERLRVAEDYARLIGVEPSYLVWMAFRSEWINGYNEARPDSKGNSGDAAWNDFEKLLLPFGLQRPSSSTTSAKKKAKERSSKETKLLERYQSKSVDDLVGMRRLALEKAAIGSDAAEKIADELKKVIRIRTKDETKETAKILVDTRKTARSLVGKCKDLEKLEAVIEILDDGNEIEFSLGEDDEDMGEED